MKKLMILFIVGSVLAGCQSTKVIDPQVQNLLAGGSFEIVQDYANPLVSSALNQVANSGLLPPGDQASSISLFGTDNYIRVINDSVAVDLPYFGTRRAGNVVGTNSGISYRGVPADLVIESNEAKKTTRITFTGRGQGENFGFSITVQPNGNSFTQVNSMTRTAISYDGHIGVIKALKKE